MSLAEATQKPIIEILKRRNLKFTPFWVQNSIVVFDAPKDLVLLIAQREDVKRIISSEPLEQDPLPAVEKIVSLNTSTDSIEWNVEWIKAPKLWEQGFYGQGIVVGGADTGVQWDHEALKTNYRGYKEDGSVDHNYNWSLWI